MNGNGRKRHADQTNQPVGEPRGVLWDLDGTLIDSAEWHWQSWREILHAEGYPITHDEFLLGFGRRNDEVLREYFGADAEADRLNRLGLAKEDRYRAFVAEHGVEVLPGVRDWLGRLTADGWRMAVASSAPRQNIGILLEVSGLAPHFNTFVGHEDVRAGKPDPEVFLLAAERLGVSPGYSIVVEDAAAGVFGSHRASMRAIGVGHKHDELGAERSVETLDQLPADAFDALLAAEFNAGRAAG